MAAVQLKDLMDPLVKIQKSTEDTSDKIDKLIQVVTGSSTVGDSLNQAILAELQAQTQLLKNIAGSGGGLSSLFGKGGGGKSKLGESGDALKLLGAGTAEMAKALILFTFVPKKTVVKFQTFVIDIFNTLTEYDQKEIKQGAANLMLMGDAIMNFSKSLALSALLIIPGLIAIPFLVTAIGLMSGVMWLMGKQEKNIKKGAKALDRVGDAIKSFAIGMAFFAVTTFFILMEPKILLGMVASLLLIGGVVGVLGLVDKTIKKGATALMLMGVGLGLFAVGYAVFALVSKFVSFEDVGKQALILGGIGLVTALLGAGLSLIAQGALSLALIGVALIPFGIGYAIFALSTKGIGIEDVGVQMAVLGGIGVVMGLVGVAVAVTAGAALLGPLLFAAAGLSLVVLAAGLYAMQQVNFTENDSKNLGITLGAVAMAFSGADPEAGFFKNVGNVFGRVVQSGGMLAAAAGFAAAGVSLIALSFGLKAFKRIGWDDKKITVDGKEIGSDSYSLSIALGSITAAFTQAGGEPSDPGGLFGKVFGTAFSPNAVERGIDSVMGAGKALTNIARGLTDFNKFANSGVEFGQPDAEGNYPIGTIGYNVTNVIGFIQKAFAAVGNEENVDSGGFFGSLFNIKRNKVEEGIRSVMDAGDALTGIAEGLMAFQDLVKVHVDFPALGKSISDTVGFVQQAFAAVAEEKNVEGGGFFDTLFSIKRNKVEEGIRSVKGAGEELKNIAESLIAFNDLAKTSIPFGDAKNPVEGTLAYAVIKSLGFVRNAFAVVGGMETDDSALFGLISWDENLVKKGIDAVKGAGEELTNIANGLMTFSKLENPNEIAATIKSLLESMSGTFASFYDQPEFSTRVDNFSNFITSIADRGEDGSLMKAADGFKEIANAINSVDLDKADAFKGLFEASARLTDPGRDLKALEALVEAIEDIRDAISEQNSGGGALGGVLGDLKSALGFKSEEAVPAATGDASLGATLSRLQITLNQINATMSNLPADIAAIEIRLPQD